MIIVVNNYFLFLFLSLKLRNVFLFPEKMHANTKLPQFKNDYSPVFKPRSALKFAELPHQKELLKKKFSAHSTQVQKL